MQQDKLVDQLMTVVALESPLTARRVRAVAAHPDRRAHSSVREGGRRR